MRNVLGDALFEIRLPIMDMGDFKHHVAKSKILSDSEARDLFTLLVGVEPDRQIAFKEEPRCGPIHRPYKQLDFQIDKVKNCRVNFPQGVYCMLRVTGLKPGLQMLEISEVEFCNAFDMTSQINNCQLIGRDIKHTAAKIERVPDLEREDRGMKVYKAIFKPTVKFPNNSSIQVNFKSKVHSGMGTVAVLSGTKSSTLAVRGQAVTLCIEESADFANHRKLDGWYALLGFKMNIATNDTD